MRDLEDRIFEIVSQNEKNDLEQEILHVYDESLEDGINADELQRLLELLAQRDMEKSVVLASAQQSLLSLDVASIRPRVRPENLLEERPRVRPRSRPDNINEIVRIINAQKATLELQNETIGSIFKELEGEDGFQERKNNEMTLNQALDTYGFPEYVLSTLPMIFGRELDQEEINQLILLVKYTTSIESKYGYNITRNDILEKPSGYFQLQVGDGVASKEVYDYGTKTFLDAGEWGVNDREVEDHEGDNRQWVRRVWKDSSYDTALRSLPISIREGNANFARDFEKIGKPLDQKFSSLNSQEQIILFLSVSMEKLGGQEYFDRILLGDRFAIVDMYIKLHNTNPEDDTERSKRIYNVIRGRAEEVLGITYR